MPDAERVFIEGVVRATEVFCADYRSEHHDDEPAEVEAFCRGFHEAVALYTECYLLHVGGRYDSTHRP